MNKMLRDKVIQHSLSTWASPVFLVTKTDGSICYYVDNRKLNNVTVKDSYPLPHTQDCLDLFGFYLRYQVAYNSSYSEIARLHLSA